MRNALSEAEFIVLAAAIGVVGDAKLRQTVATEVWAILQKHTVSLHGHRQDYDREKWNQLCGVSN